MILLFDSKFNSTNKQILVLLYNNEEIKGNQQKE